MKPGYVIEPVVPAEDRRTTPERRTGPAERRAERDTPDRRRTPERRAAAREVQQLVRVHGITDDELRAIATQLQQEQQA